MVASFEWDPDKDAENQRKHGVSFAEAQAVFLDSARVIARDLEHSRTEPRFYCFGRVADGVLTVRFTIAEMSFASSVPDTGAEARNTMKHTRKYTNEPLGRVEMVEDFLPPPDQLVLREDGVKVTISLSKKSVDFFKAHAARSKVPYQRMIRTLLDSYADKYSERTTSSRPAGRRSP